MATNISLKNELAARRAKEAENTPAKAIESLLKSDSIKSEFEEHLGENTDEYINSIIGLVNNGTSLQHCEPMSIISACITAAKLDLRVDKKLDYLWLLPYKKQAYFLLGYKGYIQLALKSTEYKCINVVEVHEGELAAWNPLTEEISLDIRGKKSDAIIGYAAYFELVKGFKKAVYRSKEQIDAVRKKCDMGEALWKSDYNGAAKKVVIRDMLLKYGFLSSNMEKAFLAEVHI